MYARQTLAVASGRNETETFPSLIRLAIVRHLSTSVLYSVKISAEPCWDS
jgi:hypothetical protein